MGEKTFWLLFLDRAIQGGMEASEAAWLVSAVGVSNTVGRVICGVLSSCPGIDALLINNIALTLGGIATMASSLSLTPAYQFSYSAAFGFTLGMDVFKKLDFFLILDFFSLFCVFEVNFSGRSTGY